jgi:hypothetical protein
VINRGNGLAEEAARKIADHRHDGLKYAKGDGGERCLASPKIVIA